MKTTFDREWRDKVDAVRASRFWREVVSKPPLAPVPRGATRPGRHEVRLDSRWRVVLDGPVTDQGPASVGIDDLVCLLHANFGVSLRRSPLPDGPRLVFELARRSREPAIASWDRSFRLTVTDDEIRVRAFSEGALLRASLYLTNTWRLRRLPALARGRRTVRPAVDWHIGADLWGGFNTTHAWIHGREDDANFVELARMGVNLVPVMATFEDYCDAAPAPFRSLVNPRAAENRARLARLACQMARADVHLMLLAYNPRLADSHPVFRRAPASRGASQHGGKYRCLCSSDPATRRFLVSTWASLFRDIPELGGMQMISGGEAFYHCFMRSDGARDCPRCSRRDASETVAELTNAVARGVHAVSPRAVMVTWPYSAGEAWSHDRDQDRFIRALDPAHVVLQTEIDNGAVDWRPAGYAKSIGDYSISYVSTSTRCRRQRRLCRARKLPFSCKIEINNSIECLNVPWLPVLENQRRIWENCRRLRPEAVHSRWLFDGSCKSPSEELGYWTLWGQGTPYAHSPSVLDAMARRDFGNRAAPLVLRAWGLFSEAMRHHPMHAYYIGTFFIGPAQPLVLDPKAVGALDRAFFGHFYWSQQEGASTQNAAMYEDTHPLFYVEPAQHAYFALTRRGPDRGRNVAVEELRAMATLWARGADLLAKARPLVPPECRERYEREWKLGKYLAYTWRSGANVEEFLRLRYLVSRFSDCMLLREGHLRENLRDTRRMRRLAEDELRIAREALDLVKGVDFLDTSLRLDMGVASSVDMLKAKIRQVTHLLKVEFPKWEKDLHQW